MHILGIDIGGSGIKGNPVDTETGEMLGERYRIPTPKPATPDAVLETLCQIAKQFSWQGPVGCGYPGVVRGGVIHTAANLDDSLIGMNLARSLEKAVGSPAMVINDADAAGLAEMRFGAGKGEGGLVLVITIGTGIGTALFAHGHLVPNTEFGHIKMKLHKDPKWQEAEKLVADSARKREDITWKQWAARFNSYLAYMQMLLNPDLVILGGGAAKKGEKFMPYLKSDVPLKTAVLENRAGIIGAAMGSREYGADG